MSVAERIGGWQRRGTLAADPSERTGACARGAGAMGHYVKDYGMSTIHLHQTTTSTPEQFLVALIDFGLGRSKLLAAARTSASTCD